MTPKKSITLLSAPLALALVACVTSSPASTTVAAKKPSSSIKSMIDSKCVGCHNDKRHPEGVNLSSYKNLMSSNVAVAGHPEKSRLVTYVDGTKSPRMPMGKPALAKKDIAAIKAWVKAGAHSWLPGFWETEC